MTDERDENEYRADVETRLAKAEAAVRVYDTLGVELVAQLKTLKARVDALEGRTADIVGPS